eukprot:s23_g26.t1
MLHFTSNYGSPSSSRFQERVPGGPVVRVRLNPGAIFNAKRQRTEPWIFVVTHRWLKEMIVGYGQQRLEVLWQSLEPRKWSTSLPLEQTDTAHVTPCRRISTAELSDSAPKDGQAKATGGVTAPPGISSTTPVKAGGSMAVPGEKAAPKAARPQASFERTSSDAGAKAGQLLLNLVNNKEEKKPTPQGAGAALLQQLKGGGKKPEVRSDDGAGMALLQQVKNGATEKSWTQGTGAGWSWWNPGKSTAYEGDWEDWGQGKAGKKGKSDWATWNSGADWWGYGQDWSQNEAQWWAQSAPQWTRQTPKKGKGKGGRQASQDTSEGSNDSDDSNQPKAAANSRWRQQRAKPEKGAGRGKGPSDAGKTQWKPSGAAKSGK